MKRTIKLTIEIEASEDILETIFTGKDITNQIEADIKRMELEVKSQ